MKKTAPKDCFSLIMHKYLVIMSPIFHDFKLIQLNQERHNHYNSTKSFNHLNGCFDRIPPVAKIIYDENTLTWLSPIASACMVKVSIPYSFSLIVSRNDFTWQFPLVYEQVQSQLPSSKEQLGGHDKSREPLGLIMSIILIGCILNNFTNSGVAISIPSAIKGLITEVIPSLG